ncbi:MAG: hypothetical protein QF807_01660 [Candidatus Thalassarchaeaceae archaeon]|nr:hypothetical protein [Candidatus Thalassarchaeaceae archaeon]
MHPKRASRVKAIAILLLMVLTPLSAADIASWSGPSVIASTGNNRTVDGWSVPGNSTILDGWLNIDSGNLPSLGNGSGWDGATANSNFTSGTYADSTSTHFDGVLSLDTNGSYGNIDEFNSAPVLSLASGITSGGTGAVWEPTYLNYSGTPAPGGGNTVGNGTIPAAPTEGNVVVGTNPNGGVPAGSNAWLVGTPTTIPTPIANFTFEFDHWYHINTPNNINGDMDGVWVEYRLDNGSWTWMAPASGYNNTISPSATVPAGTNQSANGTHGFPVWAKTAYSGWEHSTFELDNLTGINNATQIDFRFRIWTHQNSTVRPGWFIDNITLQNIGAGTGFWHHGCYAQTGTCTYSNNAIGALQLNQPLNLSGVTGNPILRTHLEWDLEGSGWDNFCVELSLNNNTWVDISSTNSATTTACRSRAGAIPGNGYTIGGTTYTDETNAFVNLDLSIPSAFQNQSTVYLRYRVDTDSSVQYGGTMDGQEGLTLNDIQVRSGSTSNSTIYFQDSLSNSGSAFHYGIGTTVEDWSYVIIGAGGLHEQYGFEDSPTMPPGGWNVANAGTGDIWEYGTLAAGSTFGPAAWSTGNFGFGVDLDNSYDSSSLTHLYSPGYTIPLGASARLSFDQWRRAESGYDGGAVFISVNNGSWQYFDPVLANGSSWYDGAQNGFGGHILANLDVFDGRQFVQGAVPWETTTADLSNYSGSHLEFRFTFAADSIINYDGWYIDDVGVEVDFFENEGSWLSPTITLDELGDGFVDISALTPNGTWVSGTITDSAGNAFDGYENLTFPISLAGIDRDTYPTAKVQVNMGTNDPFISPLIENVHYGAVRYFTGLDAQNGWDIDAGLTLVNGNWTNPTAAPLTITGDFVASTAPIQYVNVSGIGTGVTFQLLDSQGNIVGNSALNQMVGFTNPEPGYGVRFSIASSGQLSSAVADGNIAQPTLNPEIDVTNDGTVDWTFPTAPNFGHYGWQSYIHSIGSTQTSTGTTTASITSTTSGSGIDFLIPEGAITNSGMITFIPTSATSSSLVMSVAGVQAQPLNAGLSDITYAPLDGPMVSAINNAATSYTDPGTGRDWKVIGIDFTSPQFESIDILSISLSYDITENLTGLGQQMFDYHASQLAGSIPPSVEIPLSFVADAGAVGLSGGINHELMITNSPFTVPETMYPDGQIYEIVTRHHHLTDNNEIGEVMLIGTASDGEILSWHVTDLASGGIFVSNVSTMATLLPTSTATLINGEWVVKWQFEIGWFWDDVGQIDWMARALNQTGEGLAPAFAMSGGPGKNAVENDLQIDLFEVRDQFDRLVTINLNQDFYVEGGSDLFVTGSVRFQDNANLRPLTNAYSVAVNFSGTDYPTTSHDNGSFSTTLTTPNNSGLVTLNSRIVRVGPASGSFGGEDESDPMETVSVYTDVTAPNAENLQVLTTSGLLDANGHVWSPYQTLELYMSATDTEALGEDVTLYYWREDVDDSNQDGVADENEYQNMTRPISMPGRANEQQIHFTGIDVTSVPSNGMLSLYISGIDWAGHSFTNTGASGVDNDKATMVIGIEADTTLLENSFELDTVNDYLLMGQNHQISMIIEDLNGIHTIDEVVIYLAGQSMSPAGEIHIDPRESTATTPFGSFVNAGQVTLEPIDATASRITLDFNIDWQFPDSFQGNWLMPGIHVIDDTQTVANVNNIDDLRWMLDNQLTASIDMLHDLTEPLSESSESRLYLGKGDIFAITGNVVYAGSGSPIDAIPDGLQLQAAMVANGITSDVLLDLTESYFNTTLSIPIGYPSTNSLLVTVDVINIPGQGRSIINTNITLAIDSTPPVAEFPPGVLTSIETDRMSSIDVRVNVLESGGMSEDAVTLHWVYRRGGLNIPGSADSITLDFNSHIGEIWVYSSLIDMTPPSHFQLQEGDQVAIWITGADLAGNEMFGEGTADSPRAPQLIIRIFEPVLYKVEIDQLEPSIGTNVYIQTTIRNNGTTMGSINVTLVEELDDGTLEIYESHNVSDLAPLQKRVVAFSWEAWDSGKPDLYIMWDDDPNQLTILNPQIEVLSDDTEGGFFGGGSSMGMVVIGLLSILILGVVIAVIAVMMKNRDEWDDEEAWEDAEEYAEKMLNQQKSPEVTASDAEPVTTFVAEVPADAPLPEQAPPQVSDDEWLLEAKEYLPDWPDESLLGYKANGWSVEQLVEWKNNNP